jgi:uncharacterized repeat protein (TIGR01451 family)
MSGNREPRYVIGSYACLGKAGDMGRLRRTRFVTVALMLAGGGLVTSLEAAGAANTLFHPYATYYPGSSPTGVATGDVTGDGRPDMLLTTGYNFDPATDFSLWVYPQKADGGLGSPTQLGTGAAYGSAMAVAVADLDEDGDLDAAVTTTDGVQIFKQAAGTLAYEWTVPIQGGRDLELADVSGDGLADLVVNTKDSVAIWWQINGDFMSSPTGARLVTSGQVEVEVADVTGDGRADLVTAEGRTVVVRAQQADRSFAAAVSYASGGIDPWATVNGLAVGDVDTDGLVDVHVSVGGNSPNAWVVTRQQQPDGTLGAAQVRKSYDIPESLEVADVTGDGRGDLVVLHGGWNRMGVYDTAPGTLQTEELYPIPYASHYTVDGLAVGDVSGDGRADVAVADYTPGLVLLRAAVPGADTTEPDTTVTSGPSGTHHSRTATFGFAASEPATFTCSLDGSAWSPCTSPATYDGLTAGWHTFRVRASDAVGNTDSTPAQWSAFVDGPETAITGGPSGTIRSTSATFAFDSSMAVTRFECSMDDAAWSACTSPVTSTGLVPGSTHTFEVRGVNAEGLVDSTPATRSFTVDQATNLGLALVATPDPVKRGSTLTYTARVTNLGPSGAADLVLAHALPSGLTFASATTAVGSCIASDSPATVRCSLGYLGAGATWTVTVRGTVTATKGTLASTAVVTTSSWDVDQDNDAASTSTHIGGKGR